MHKYLYIIAVTDLNKIR